MIIIILLHICEHTSAIPERLVHKSSHISQTIDVTESGHKELARMGPRGPWRQPIWGHGVLRKVVQGVNVVWPRVKLHLWERE